MGNKISVIIPHYPFSTEINNTLKKCIASLKGFDELIIVSNQGTGFAFNVNLGLSLATGDYLIILNNDTILEGDFRDLIDENCVTSPLLNDDSRIFWGACFCLPRWVYEEIGELDEQFKIGYYEDDDYLMRLKQAGIFCKSNHKVKIYSPGSTTMDKIDKMKKRGIAENNKQRFIKKWGQEPPIEIITKIL